MCIWQDGFKLRDYRKAESDIRMVGDKIATKQTHFYQHPELQILVPHPASKKDERLYIIHIYTYITYYILPIICCVLIAY